MEPYLRPPLLAREPPSPAARAWRWRAFALLALLGLAALATYLALTLAQRGGQHNPGVAAGRLPAAASRPLPVS